MVRLFLLDATTFETRSWLATVRPGARTIRVPVEVTGDTLYVSFAPGGTTAELTIPTITDAQAEPDEIVEPHPLDDPAGPVLTGVVTAGWAKVSVTLRLLNNDDVCPRFVST